LLSKIYGTCFAIHYMEIQPTSHACENRHPEDSSRTFYPGFCPGFHRGDEPE